MARTVTVEVDSREQIPLMFPESLVWCPIPYERKMIHVRTVVKELDFGDYRLEQHPDCCVIERKKDMDEIATNLLTADRARFERAWGRFLGGCKYPLLLIEQGFASSNKMRGQYKKITPPDVMGSLYRLIPEAPHLNVIWCGQTVSPATRRVLGAQLVRVMLSFADYESRLPRARKEAENPHAA